MALRLSSQCVPTFDMRLAEAAGAIGKGLDGAARNQFAFDVATEKKNARKCQCLDTFHVIAL